MEELDYVFSQLEQAKRYCIDVETVDRGYPDITLVGIAMAWTHEHGVYIPVGHREGAQLPQDLVLERLKAFIEGNPNKVAVMHNAKYDMTVLTCWVGYSSHRTSLTRWLRHGYWIQRIRMG
jgi:DNA polymerase-1